MDGAATAKPIKKDRARLTRDFKGQTRTIFVISAGQLSRQRPVAVQLRHTLSQEVQHGPAYDGHLLADDCLHNCWQDHQIEQQVQRDQHWQYQKGNQQANDPYHRPESPMTSRPHNGRRVLDGHG